VAFQHLDHITINSIVGLSKTKTIFNLITLPPTNNTPEDHTLRIKGVHSLTKTIQAILYCQLREVTSPMTLDHPARYMVEQIT
jgi:hypothetical protein